MRILLILLLIVAAFIGYQLYLQKPIEPVTPRQPAAAVATSQRIECPSCNGEGRLMLRADAERHKPYVCMRCGGRGYAEITLPASGHAIICPDCNGMGKRLWNPEALDYVKAGDSSAVRFTAKACLRCVGKGFISRPPAR